MPSRSRLAGVDAARGLAVLGMVAVHVLPETTDDGGTSVAYAVASGRSAAAFAVLAGVGVALASRSALAEGGGLSRGRLGRQRLRLLVRALLVGAVGLLLGSLDTGVAVILAYYAVFFVLLLPFLGWPPRRLLAAAATVAVAAPVLGYLTRPRLPPFVFENPTWSSLADPGGLACELLLTGVYPAVPWAAYLLTGLAVGRLALERARTALALATAGAALALAATAASALLLGPLGGGRVLPPELVDGTLFGSVPTDTPWWLAVDARHSGTTPDLVATTGTALLALGACLLLAPRAGRVLGPVAAVGSMPLTVYALHLLVLHLTDADDPLRSYLLQIGAALVLAPLWRRTVGRGPLEAAVAAVAAASVRTVRAPT